MLKISQCMESEASVGFKPLTSMTEEKLTSQLGPHQYMSSKVSANVFSFKNHSYSILE